MPALTYRIYYDNGSTYDGDPFCAPAFGVLVIVERDRNAGRRLVSKADYYCLDDRGDGLDWYEADFVGLIDYLATPGKKKVVFGRLVANAVFERVFQDAYHDPDFPPKTSPVLRHNGRKV